VTTQTAGVQLATVSYSSIQPPSPAIATFTAAYQWDDEGRMTSMSPSLSLPTSWPNSASFPAMGYQYDANGRLATMTSNGSNFATASYTPAGQLYQLSYGGLTETDTYNSMLQLISQYVPNYLNMNYNYSPTKNNGRITSSMDYATGENTSYTYDTLNRLVGASNSLWSGTYTYDGFGNLLSKSGSGGSPNAFPSMTASYNANNQLTAASYDANGNTISANGYSYGYTVENKRNAQNAAAWPYAQTLYGNDPWGKRVMKETNPDPDDYEGEYNPLWEFYFYTINGQKLVTIDCNNANAQYQPNCWVVGENVYFKKKLLVSNGVYVVTDRLGTVRGNTQGEGFEYYPFGEERTNRPDGRDKFATYFRDGVGQDYAEQRYHNAGMGRFWSPDPGGIKTADPTDPGSWNRYGYVSGDPINYLDPVGTNRVDPQPTFCDVYPDDPSCDPWYEPFQGKSGAQKQPDCSSQFGGSWGLWSGFVLDHYSDTVSLSAEANLPSEWIMAWASVESSWGQGPVFVPTGNYFGWRGVGDIPCAGGVATFHNDGCFSSFEASAMTALFSTNNNFKYGGYTGVSADAILTDNSYDGAAAAFQALANAGFNTDPTNGPKYGATIAERVRLVDRVENCLRTKGDIQ
jgi:RHS repeat-associated protein